MAEQSDQEIDLRPYVLAVLDKWYWIVGAGIVGAVLGIAVSFLLAPSYEATALVAITEPRQKVQLDPRIESVADDQPLDAYPELALSDELLNKVIGQLPDGYDYSLTEIRAKLEARPGGDPSILRMTASDGDPASAAQLANIWAEVFVIWASQIYGDQGDEQLLFFEAQLDEAAGEMQLAEQALVEFQARNRSSILENELLALQQTQADYLAKQRQTELIVQDSESLLAQEASSSGSDQASIDQLASLLLQIRALGGVPNSVESTMPWQIQLNLDGQSSLSAGEQRAIISNLHEILLDQSKQVEERLGELEPQLLSVQQQKQEANAEENRLIRDLTVSEETYTALSRAVDEKRITSQDTASGVRLASKTSVPEYPTGPRKAFVAIGGGLLGATLAAAAIVLMTWWREE